MKNYILIILAVTFISCSEKPRFELLDSKKTGIDFNNRIDDSDSLHVLNFEYIYNGAGVGIADLNNDGMQDIVFTANQEAPRIYLNEGNFKFSDISSAFEDLDGGQWYSGVTFADINDDGWTDVYLTCTAYDDSLKRKNRFYINQGLQGDGSLQFQDQAESYGVADDSYTVHAAFFDYDLDGDLDLFLLNNYRNDRLSASYRPKITDGSAPSNDDLYRNNGDGTFTNVSRESGIVYEGFSLGLALADVNKDGYPDIYVSNDYISNDLLYINQGDGTFQNSINTYLSYQSKSSMGSDIADINNDGNPEIFTLDMMPEYYHLKKQTIGGYGYIYYINDAKYGYEHQYLRNMLHLHNGFIRGDMIPYSELGQMMGLYQTEWSWSPLFADFDNDGDKDLYVTNGYPRDMTDKDWAVYRSEIASSNVTPQSIISKMPSVRVANCIFENEGDIRFSRRYGRWMEEIPSFSYGAAYADLDGDGDLDYVVNNLNDKAFLYRNRTQEENRGNGNYLKITLKGEGPNTSAIGAKVELWYDGYYQYHENFPSRGYASTVDPVIHFGLSDHPMIDSVRVTWPATSRVSKLEDIKVNQFLEINEKESGRFQGDPYVQKEIDYLFSSEKGILEYYHQQEDKVDFHYSQRIIPHKYSQIGPCMQKGDLNNDGMDDIIIGATNKLPTTVFLRQGKGFVKTEMEGLTRFKDCPESDFAIIDVDLDGDQDVIALAGGYENKEDEYIHYLYENKHGSFSRTPLPTSPFPASVVRPVDFDRDGDMDLFIGARIGLEIFPFSANSWFLVNDNGRYTSENSLNFFLGMVTDALWSDYDGDGWEDLLVTREWNNLTLLKNLDGERIQFHKFPEVDSIHGIWYSLAAADFDLDGDVDFILGNLGDNHRFTVSNRYPMKIYALDMDLNGTLDPISTAFWKDPNDVMKEFPIHYFDELMSQSPYFLGSADDYTSFSYMTIDEILHPALMNRVDYSLRVNTTSSYILWNNKGSFTWEKLPRSAQVSPIKKIIVKDLNMDRYPDVILAGNDHTYDVSTGYYDANKGIILLSQNSKPLCAVLGPSESGLMLHGMVESLLYLEGDGPLIVAGLNRDSIHVFSMMD